METNTNSPSSKIAEMISNGLKRAQQEMNELADQLSLDKADVTEKFEEIKKEFIEKTNEWKQDFSEIKSLSIENVSKLKSKLEELQVQLSLGKAEAKDLFEEQRKKILYIIHDIETEVKANPALNERFENFRVDVEKFKLKLEIVKLKFELKKFDVRDEFKKEMSVAKMNIDKIFDRVEGKKDDMKRKYSDFSKEIDLAYQHIRKAVGKL